MEGNCGPLTAHASWRPAAARSAARGAESALSSHEELRQGVEKVLSMCVERSKEKGNQLSGLTKVFKKPMHCTTENSNTWLEGKRGSSWGD